MTVRPDRLHALDAVRGFALLAGVVLHAAMAFLPGFDQMGWPLADTSPSTTLGVTFFVIHLFRMTLFFVIAGLFGHLLYHRLGLRGFVRNRSIRIVVPLVVGWIVVFPLIAIAFSWGLSQTANAAAVAPIPVEAPRLAFPLTHLWFLYVLVWLYAVVLALRAITDRWIDREGALRRSLDRLMRVLVQSYAAPVVCAIPVFVAMTSGQPWARWFGITTPDQSLIPNLIATAAFATAFVFGWVVDRQRERLLPVWQRQWPVYLLAAVALTTTCVWIVGVSPVFIPAPLDDATRVYAALYAVASWAWTLGIIGFALRFFSNDSPRRRYISDASYWIYLLHLPVIFLLEASVKSLPIHWAIKFPAIVVAALAVLLASYHYLVRHTIIGEVLNGRRHRAAPESPTRPLPVSNGASSAELVGVRKKYGDTVALDGVDLQVRPGELLAVLGPNGAGKSTAIAVMLGLLRPDEGDARLFGTTPDSIEARGGVGVMMQEVALAPELRVRELVDLTTHYYPAPMSANEAMRLTNTTDLAHRPYAKLSTGQKRQVQFALAICGRPALLFLDEPTVGLDVGAREGFWSTIRGLVAQGVSIVLTTHYLEEAEALADRVVVLAKGRVIAAGSVDDIRAIVDRKRIRCVTSLRVDEIRTWPGVVSATTEGAAVVVIATDADAVVRRLLNIDGEAHDLEIQRAGLAEAVSALTREAA